MLKFVARVFVTFLEVFLWLNLVGSAIAGAVIGGNSGGGGYAVLGFILGAVAGIITNIIFGGILAIYVNMSKEISELRKDVKGISSASVVATSSVAGGVGICPNCKKPLDASSIKVGLCNKCGLRL